MDEQFAQNLVADEGHSDFNDIVAALTEEQRTFLFEAGSKSPLTGRKMGPKGYT